MEGGKRVAYEAENFHRVVACTGSVVSLCKAQDRDGSYASAVVPGPFAQGSDARDPFTPDPGVDFEDTPGGAAARQPLAKNPCSQGFLMIGQFQERASVFLCLWLCLI